VVEIERPRRGERRRGKSDPIDAHLAALHALRLAADRLPTPRADGDREAARYSWPRSAGVQSPWPARGACSPRFTPRIDRLTTRLGDEISGGDPSPVHLYRNSFEPLYRHRRHCDDGPAGGMSSRVVLSEPGR
jgi:hypothetical protein